MIKRQPDGSIAVSAHKRYLWTRKVIFANGIHATRHDPNLAKILHPACVHTIVFENNDTLAHPLIMDVVARSSSRTRTMPISPAGAIQRPTSCGGSVPWPTNSARMP